MDASFVFWKELIGRVTDRVGDSLRVWIFSKLIISQETLFASGTHTLALVSRSIRYRVPCEVVVYDSYLLWFVFCRQTNWPTSRTKKDGVRAFDRIRFIGQLGSLTLYGVLEGVRLGDGNKFEGIPVGFGRGVDDNRLLGFLRILAYCKRVARRTELESADTWEDQNIDQSYEK